MEFNGTGKTRNNLEWMSVNKLQFDRHLIPVDNDKSAEKYLATLHAGFTNEFAAKPPPKKQTILFFEKSPSYKPYRRHNK